MVTITPHQIVYLASHTARLYAEVIQITDERQICWARPWLLVEGIPGPMVNLLPQGDSGEDVQIYELADGPDLLWPVTDFLPALDVDILNLLGQLRSHATPAASSTSRSQVQAFMRQLWAASTAPACSSEP